MDSVRGELIMNIEKGIQKNSEKFTFEIEAKSFKRFDDPYLNKNDRVKYRFYANVKDIPNEIEDWMETNPRFQKLTTDVSRAIRDSLLDTNDNFHLLNRGILLSAESVTYDNNSKKAKVTLTDDKLHGNVDGGHTFKIILANKDKLLVDKYVEMEIITGISSSVDLADARNTSIQVDQKSLEELQNTFEVLKSIFESIDIDGHNFYNRIAFKQNEHYEDLSLKGKIIDVRELIAILNMFNPHLYSLESSTHPIQSYSGKETSLDKFLQMGLPKNTDPLLVKNRRDKVMTQMSLIIPDIFKLWDLIEIKFTDAAKDINKRYGRKKYSNFDDGDCIGKSLFSDHDISYSIPKGIMYPLVGAFRSLIVTPADEDGKYSWAIDPFKVWDEKKEQLVNIVLNSSVEAGDNPNQIGKSSSAWDMLFKEIYIYRLMNEKK